MKTRIQVLSTEVKSGIGKASQKAYSMTICQCVIHGDKMLVGELVLPKDHPDVKPGMYDGEFGISIDQQTKRISGALVQLTPVAVAKGA